MTDHPIDTEALRAELEAAVADYRTPNIDLVVHALSALTAAEHRATRAEAQSAIRGRAVAIYRERAREAEAERDEWRQTALDERGAALDLLEQIKVRDRRIQAVQHLVDQADHAGDWTVTCSRLQWAIDGTTPTIERQETR